MTVDDLTGTLRDLAKEAASLAFNWMSVHKPSAQELLEDIPDMLSAHISSATVLAADWYVQLAPNSSYMTTRDADFPEEKVANLAKWVHAGPQTPESRMKSAASRLVFDAARRTVYVNADREGVGLARHEEESCCNQCVARATTVIKHRDSTGDVPDAFFHPGCEGLYVPIRDGSYEPPGHAREWGGRIAAARRAGNHDPDMIANWLDAH